MSGKEKMQELESATIMALKKAWEIGFFEASNLYTDAVILEDGAITYKPSEKLLEHIRALCLAEYEAKNGNGANPDAV